MYFLRFPDEATYLAALEPFRDHRGNVLLPNFDVIGPIYRPGVYDSAGEQLTAPELVPGFHANSLDEPPEGLQPYLIDPPLTPHRLFAGV